MTEFFLVVSGILLSNALVLSVLAWAYHQPQFQPRRMSMRTSIRVPIPERVRVMLVISAISLACFFGPTYLFWDRLFVQGETSLVTVLWQSAAILVFYDFIYYWLHRAMHIKKLMRFVHGVHHRAHNPSTLESFFQHPIETVAGISLLYVSLLVFGPVHVQVFYVVFFLYSTMNILVHSGLVLPGLVGVNFLAKKHHIHHQDDYRKNFSSLTPLPDFIFGTLG